jgi:hypothetical protein
MRQKTKALAYVRRMITSSKWNGKIPSATKIAERIAVSAATIRHCLHFLEANNVLENNGSRGYFVIPKKFSELYSVNRQLYYLSMLQRNIRIAKLIDDGGKVLGNFVVVRKDNNLQVADIASGDVVTTSKQELYESVRNPIKTEDLIELKGKSLNDARTQYLRQRRLSPIFTAIQKSTKRFEI